MRQFAITFFFLAFNFMTMGQSTSTAAPKKKASIATFGGGCFWCTEALFQEIKGVDSVVSGYSGGDIPNPTYKLVSSGKSSYVEVAQIYYDNKKVDYRDLLEIFFKTHDPTSLNRQGNDVGLQYRSVVFYHDEEQKKQAEEAKKNIQRDYTKPIVTAIEPFKNFYKAEEDHQDFYRRNSQYPYCRIIIKPKIEHLMKDFSPFVHLR